MKYLILGVIVTLFATTTAQSADETKPPVQRHPHMVSLTYYLSDVHEGKDADAMVAALKKIKSVDVVEVRGRGLWIGIELKVLARPYCEALLERGVLCKETHETVIRLAPPLVIEKSDLEWGIEQVEAVVG